MTECEAIVFMLVKQMRDAPNDVKVQEDKCRELLDLYHECWEGKAAALLAADGIPPLVAAFTKLPSGSRQWVTEILICLGEFDIAAALAGLDSQTSSSWRC
eukprot:COSAG02_NODE_14546_length_1260_cov_6.224806_2_plen_101_part_00